MKVNMIALDLSVEVSLLLLWFLGNHWDDVIQQYKELELANYKVHDNVQSILGEVQDKISEVMQEKVVFLAPHVIDLSAEGSIGTVRRPDCERRIM